MLNTECIEIFKTLPVPAIKAREFFWNIEAWQRVWNPIQKVTVLYDNGLIQEFTMNLIWQNKPTTIRTVRIREANGDIVFFSPNPPGELAHHVGCWKFIDEDNNTCTVVAKREFVLRRFNNEPSEKYQVRKDAFRTAFQARLRCILDAFEQHFPRVAAAQDPTNDLD